MLDWFRKMFDSLKNCQPQTYAAMRIGAMVEFRVRGG